MTLVLDSGGISGLSASRGRLRELRSRGIWPPLVPAVVLAEALTGDHRRDFHANHLIRLSHVVDVDEVLARHAALLRTSAARKGPSAVDALVIATACQVTDPVVLTSDPRDLRALATHASVPVRVERT